MSVGVGSIPFWGGTSTEGPLYADDDPWKLAWIAGIKVPGQSDVSSTAVARLDFDDHKAKGRNGSNILIQGRKPGPFEINVEIWTPEQWTALLDLIDVVWVTPKKKSKLSQIAVDIYHPALASVKVYRAALVGVDPPKDGSNQGVKTVRFSFRESVLPDGKNATKKVGPTPPVVPPLRKDQGSKSSVPEKPSKDRKDLGPKGPKKAPAGGSD